MYAFRLKRILQGGAKYEFGIKGSASSSKSSTSSSYKDLTESEEFKKSTPAQQQFQLRRLEEMEKNLAEGGDNTGSDAQKKSLEAAQGQFDKVLGGADDQAGLNSLIGNMRDDASENLNALTSNLGTSANMAGGAGGSKEGLAKMGAAAQAGKQLNRDTGKLRYDHDQAYRDRSMQAATGSQQNAAGWGQHQQYTGDRELDRIQKGMDMTKGDMGGIQEGTGKETSSGTSKSKTKSSSLSAGGSYPSDESLKKNIKNTGSKVRVSKTGAEINEKSYEFTSEAKRLYNLPDGNQTGVVAQDVEKEDPSAVGSISSDKDKKKKRKTVDYDKLDKIWNSMQ
jgi:hypothetical protein